MPSSPVPLEYAVPPPPGRRPRPLAILGLGGAAVVAGAIVGLTTNAINGLVSPAYFIDVMGWQNGGGLYWAILAQGILEGSAVGVVLSAIMAASLALITRGTCTWAQGRRCLLETILMIYALWCIGGIAGVVYAHFQPVVFSYSYVGVPGSHRQMLAFAWVGGSIWGAEFGGVIAVVAGLGRFARRWKRIQAAGRGGFQIALNSK